MVQTELDFFEPHDRAYCVPLGCGRSFAAINFVEHFRAIGEPSDRNIGWF